MLTIEANQRTASSASENPDGTIDEAAAAKPATIAAGSSHFAEED